MASSTFFFCACNSEAGRFERTMAWYWLARFLCFVCFGIGNDDFGRSVPAQVVALWYVRRSETQEDLGLIISRLIERRVDNDGRFRLDGSIGRVAKRELHRIHRVGPRPLEG